MTATLVAKNVVGGFAHRILFEALDLAVAQGDVVGVVGANGAGKRTLLRILAGDLEPLRVYRHRQADTLIGWLRQEHERVAGKPSLLHRPLNRMRRRNAGHGSCGSGAEGTRVRAPQIP